VTWVPIRVGIRVVVGVPIRGDTQRREIAEQASEGLRSIAEGIGRDRDGQGAWIGFGAAGTLHPSAFGRCPHPPGIPARRGARRVGQAAG
jgi:hypothetical protein